MKIQYVIEQGPKRERKIDKAEEKKYAEFFWEVVGAVRGGRYRSEKGNIHAVADQIEEERRINNPLR